MSMSCRDIAQVMDPVEPAISLRQLANRHRWLSGDPPSITSLREIVARHENPGTTHQRFLWYNTFLLQGFALSPCDVPLLLEKLLESAGLDPRAAVDKLGVSPKQVVNALGISLDGLKNAFADLIDSIPFFRDIGIDDVLRGVSLHELIERFDIDPLDILLKFCDKTLGLIQAAGIPVPTEIILKPKPERFERAAEIGAAIAADYEVAALCEVFEEKSKALIQENASSAGRVVASREGPDESGVMVTSGLYTLTFDRTIRRKAQAIFQNRGEYWRDSDAWANKGILLTEVDVGVGALEVFSTHLLSGGDLVEFLGGQFDPDAETKLAIQLQQVDELVDFIGAEHKMENVAIVVGDFNIDAHVKDAYDMLVSALRKVNMLDMWPFHRHRNNPGFDDMNALPPGPTNSTGTIGGTYVDVGGVSVLGEVDHSTVNEICAPEYDRFCIDGKESKKTASRIDFVFLEQPRPEHAFVLDITRLRRRPFARTGTNIVSELWLSDHLGLDFTLIMSPRAT